MKQLLLVPLLAFATPLWAAPPADFDARVEALRREAGVPGMAIAIVEDGQTTLAQGWGVRKLGAPERVDGDTSSRPARPARPSPSPRWRHWSMRASWAGTTR